MVKSFYLLLAAANIFYASDCLIFGPEQIVGALNVGYHDDGRFYYTSPVAILFRCVLYLIFSAAVTWLAAAGCGTLLHLSHRSAGFTMMRRLLLACAFAGILIGALDFTSHGVVFRGGSFCHISLTGRRRFFYFVICFL